MQKIQPGYNIVSLFTTLNSKLDLAQGKSWHGLVMTLVGAFFIVAVSTLIMQTLLHSFSVASLGADKFTEIIAFQPAQDATLSITRGYIGK